MFHERLAGANNNINLWEQMYIVDESLDRPTKNGCVEYLLKWKKYDPILKNTIGFLNDS
ncbi:unnamed protein product, partial [Adineta steineri]